MWHSSCADFTAALVGSLHADLSRGVPLLSRRAGSLRRALDTALRLSGGDDGSLAAHRYASQLTLMPDATPRADAPEDVAAAAAAAAAVAAAREPPSELLHRVDALDCLCLDLPVDSPLTDILTPEVMGGYRHIHRFVMRAQRASDALGALWRRLRSSAAPERRGGRATTKRAGLSTAHAWHMLRLHVRELRHFVGLVQGHFIGGVCDSCWAELRDALARATSPGQARDAHAAFVRAATTHCLLHAQGREAGHLVTSVLALALSLRREVGDVDDGGGDEAGASWAVLVDASRRQFALLLASLARHPLAPPLLVHPSVVGGGAAFD